MTLNYLQRPSDVWAPGACISSTRSVKAEPLSNAKNDAKVALCIYASYTTENYMDRFVCPKATKVEPFLMRLWRTKLVGAPNLSEVKKKYVPHQKFPGRIASFSVRYRTVVAVSVITFIVEPHTHSREAPVRTYQPESTLARAFKSDEVMNTRTN